MLSARMIMLSIPPMLATIARPECQKFRHRPHVIRNSRLLRRRDGHFDIVFG